VSELRHDEGRTAGVAIGQRCRSATIRDVARELKLDWKTVKNLGKHYMRATAARPGVGPAGDRHRRDRDPQGEH
jgi:hypothetical protein